MQFLQECIFRIKENTLNNEDIQQEEKDNTKDNFKFAFEKSFINFVIDRMDSDGRFFMKILENEEFKNFIMEDMMNKVYSEVNG